MLFPLGSGTIRCRKADRCVKIKAGKGTHLRQAEQGLIDKQGKLSATDEI
jgi:hypothetical protein